MLHCVAHDCGVLQCVVVCCSGVLQCAAVCCTRPGVCRCLCLSGGEWSLTYVCVAMWDVAKCVCVCLPLLLKYVCVCVSLYLPLK